MSEGYDNTNRGVLFKNDRKEEDTHPDYKGHIDVDGTKYWLAAWINESEKVTGGKFMSITIKPKDEQPEGRSRTHASAGGSTREAAKRSAPAKKNADDLEEDIPF